MAKKKIVTRASADVTRDKILKIAQKLFSAKGFAATSISEIAKKAQINQSLIYHHFDNKETLWRQVKSNMLQRYKRLQGLDFCAIENATDFASFIDQLVSFRFDFYDQNPDIRRMIDWQYLTANRKGDRYLMNTQVLAKLRAVLERLQQQGEIRPELNLDLVLMFILHTPLSFFKARHALLSDCSKEELAKLKKQYVAMLKDCLINGLSTTIS